MRQMIYPAPPFPVREPPAGMAEVSVPLPAGGHVHGWHRAAPAAGAPALLFFHGNGENLETMRLSGLFDELGGLETHLLAVDYPGYGRSPGSPSEAAIREAAAAALAWLGERHPTSPLVVGGWSLGAAAAARVVADHPDGVSGTILMSAWTSLPAVARRHFPGLLVGLLLRESWDSLAAAQQIRGPSLLIHGARDGIIPVEQGRALAEELGPSARWVEIPDAGHNDLLARRAVWSEVAGFLNTLAP